MAGHDGIDPGIDGGPKRDPVGSFQVGGGRVHHRQPIVGVDRAPAVPGKVFGAGQHPGLVGPGNPGADLLGHLGRVGAEGASLDDRVVGHRVEIGDRPQEPIDADRPGLGTSQLTGGSGRAESA